MKWPAVPALPGFTSLQYFADESDENIQWIERLPIVAWVIDTADERYYAIPVTPDEDPRGDKALVGVGILLPDGRVIMPYRQNFPDEENWRKNMMNTANEELRKKAK